MRDELLRQTGGVWRPADDDLTNVGDHIFQDGREQLIRDVIPPEYAVEKIYLKEIGSPGRTRERIKNGIRDGALILQYAGHGGRAIWADENILHISDLSTLRNGTRNPLIVATTCEMNFFDKPEAFGARPMGEEFILNERRGAIATIGATRLTFALCNDIFDRYLFREMLFSPVNEVGALLMQAKIANILGERSIHCLPGLEQYTLFGDPALRLARPPLRAKVELETTAVNPGQEIRVRQNVLYEAFSDPLKVVKNFDGNVTVFVDFPNNLDANPENDLPPTMRVVPVIGGEFDDVVLTVPPRVFAGEGVVRLFAQSGTETAIGGARFSVRQSRILRVEHRRTANGLIVTAQLENPRGRAGIRRVEVVWSDTVDYTSHIDPMKHVGNLLYSNEANPIPLPGLGKRINYRIVVTDITGRTIDSGGLAFDMPLGPDLAVAELGRTRIPELEYRFDPAQNRWVFRLAIVNKGDQRPSLPVEVVIVEGDADEDANYILDRNADILTEGFVPVDAWKRSTSIEGEFERADIVLPLKEPLVSGEHDITVWVDPETEDDPHDDGIDGKIEESHDRNNISRKPFEITDFVVGNATARAFSLDRTFQMTVPEGATDETTLSISMLSPPTSIQIEGDDPPFLRVPVLRLANRDETAFRVLLQSGVRQLRRIAPMEFTFDYAALKDEIADELALPRVEADRTGPQQVLLKEKALEALDRIGVYEWVEDRGVWRRIRSNVRRNPDGTPTESLHITPPLANTAETHHLRVATIDIDPRSAPTGQWALYFVSENEYEVLLKQTGSLNYQRLRLHGKIGQMYVDESISLRRLLVRSDDPLAPAGTPPDKAAIGDVIRFETIVTADGSVQAVNFRSSNAGNGKAIVTLRDTATLANAPYGDWVIFFLDAGRFEVRDANGLPVFAGIGRPAIGRVDGVHLVLNRVRMDVQVLGGSKAFAFGDTFRVRVGRVMTVDAQTDRTGIFTVLRDRDTKPPTVQLWVNDETPLDGSVIPPRPTITLLISDRNGVDVDSFGYEIRKVGQGDFEEVPADAYTVNPEPIDQISVLHRPILFIGTYVFRVRIRDLAGVPATSRDGEFAEFVFVVEEQPDLAPPEFTLNTENGPLTDGETLRRTPQTFILDIRESHALNIRTLELSFGREGEPLEPVERYELEFDKTRPQTARLTWDADLPNGTYLVQAIVEDTSTNVGTLGPDAKTPFRVTIEEPVHFEGPVLNAPNPFSPLDPVTRGTFFTYTLTQPADRVSIRIYTVAGRLVKVIEEGAAARGYNETYWDGRDNDGLLVANGTYFYKVRTESVFEDAKRVEERVGKLVIVR